MLTLTINLIIYFFWFLILLFMIYPLTKINIMITISSNLLMLFDMSMNMHMNSQKMMFMFTIMTISIMVMKFSKIYMSQNFKMSKFFYITIYLFISSMFVFLINSNIYFMFIGWDGLGISSFFLINYYMNKNTSNKAMYTNITNRLGDSLLMMFLCLKISTTMSLNTWLMLMPFIISIYLMLSSFTKSAQFPFISWLPFAMAAPTPVSTLIHSSTLVTAGVYLIMCITPNKEIASWSTMMMFNKLLMVVSLTTIFVSSLLAIFSSDLKKVIALSTMNHMSMMMLMLSMNMKSMCMIHLISHAFFKSSLFMSFGMMMIKSNHSLDYRNMMKESTYNSMTSTMMKISIISLNGLMMTSGFFSKEKMIMTSMLKSNSMFMYLLISTIMIFSFSYSLRMIKLINMSKVNSNEFFVEKTMKMNSYKTYIIQSLMSIMIGWMMMNKMMWESTINSMLIKEESIFMLTIYFTMMTMSMKLINNKKIKTMGNKLSNKLFNMDMKTLNMMMENNKEQVSIFMENGMSYKYLQYKNLTSKMKNITKMKNYLSKKEKTMMIMMTSFILMMYLI